MATIQQHNAQILKELKPGELVEFPRNPFISHWGVYVGDEKVIHFSGRNNPDRITCSGSSLSIFKVFGKCCDKAYVCEDLFWDVVRGCKAKKNNDKDRKLSPLSSSDIVWKARSMIGTRGYNILWNNCEHFATLCRYGKKWSDQVHTFRLGIFGFVKMLWTKLKEYLKEQQSKK